MLIIQRNLLLTILRLVKSRLFNDYGLPIIGFTALIYMERVMQKYVFLLWSVAAILLLSCFLYIFFLIFCFAIFLYTFLYILRYRIHFTMFSFSSPYPKFMPIGSRSVLASSKIICRAPTSMRADLGKCTEMFVVNADPLSIFFL